MIFVARLAHILAGAFWFGTFVFVARFLMPAIKAAGPAAGPVMAQLHEGRQMCVWILMIHSSKGM